MWSIRLIIMAAATLRTQTTLAAGTRLNVLGGQLALCCGGPKTTGWLRDGYCSARPEDGGFTA